MSKFPLAARTQTALISQKIHLIRRTRVMIDSDLATLYGVSTSNLNKAVKRNLERFPKDFMFQLSNSESRTLRFRIGISKDTGRGGRRYAPYVFTEQGVAMLSSVLNSPRAVQVNIAIMRAFLQMRAMLATHEDLRRKISEMEKRYDSRFQAVFTTLKQMLETPVPTRRQIGFHVKPEPLASPIPGHN
jgi:phage regulator Rha-like protein